MKKILVAVITIALVLPFFSACNPKPEETSEDSIDANAITVKDMDGRNFRVLCWDFGYGSKSILGYTGEVITNIEDSTSASVVDTAKQNVINLVQEDYNCTITGTVYAGIRADFTESIRNMVLSGSDDYDMIFDAYEYLAPFVTDDTLVDLNTIPTIDFTNEWWDQNAREDLSILNKLYFMCGDINTYDNDGTWCMLFNKNMLRDLNLDIDLYQLVKDDKWTFDKFTEICKSNITMDANGDGILDEKDIWAFGTETYNIYVHVVAGGQKIVKKDSDDVPYFSIQNEGTYNALGKAIEFYTDKNTVMVGNAHPYTQKGFANVWEETIHKAFIEDRELFYMCGLINVPSFREMVSDFGILPVPKMHPNQDRYYHTVSKANMTAMCIPQTVQNIDDIGIVIEALGKYSREIVTPAYYDIQLKYRDARDEDSSEMLDRIFASRTYDLGAAFNWGDTLTNYMVMDMNFVSRFESIMGPAEVALENTLEKLQK